MSDSDGPGGRCARGVFRPCWEWQPAADAVPGHARAAAAREGPRAERHPRRPWRGLWRVHHLALHGHHRRPRASSGRPCSASPCSTSSNMEIERYTLATGETAVAGFVRFWKPWGVLFCLFTVVPNMWPGWATSGVTIFSFLIGGGNVPLHHLRRARRRGDCPDRLSRRLSDARAGAVLQGRPDARVPGGRDRHGDRRLGLGRAARDDHAGSDGCPTPTSCRCRSS